jgi:hypothetical protein
MDDRKEVPPRQLKSLAAEQKRKKMPPRKLKSVAA